MSSFHFRSERVSYQNPPNPSELKGRPNMCDAGHLLILRSFRSPWPSHPTHPSLTPPHYHRGQVLYSREQFQGRVSGLMYAGDLWLRHPLHKADSSYAGHLRWRGPRDGEEQIRYPVGKGQNSSVSIYNKGFTKSHFTKSSLKINRPRGGACLEVCPMSLLCSWTFWPNLLLFFISVKIN